MSSKYQRKPAHEEPSWCNREFARGELTNYTTDSGELVRKLFDKALVSCLELDGFTKSIKLTIY